MNRIISQTFAFATTVVDNSNATYKYTGMTTFFGKDTSDAVWFIARETKGGNTIGTTVYSSNPFKPDLMFSSIWDNRATIQYNANVNIEN